MKDYVQRLTNLSITETILALELSHDCYQGHGQQHERTLTLVYYWLAFQPLQANPSVTKRNKNGKLINLQQN